MDLNVAMRISAGVDGQAAIDKLNASLGNLGKSAEVSAKQTANAMRMLPAQLTDVVTQIAGGQSPFMILIQQGGQIKDMFGGVGNTFKALAGALTPARLAIGGVAGVVGALGYAFVESNRQMAEFNKMMAMTGNTVGLTFGGFKELTDKVSAAGKVSVGTAKDIVSQLVSSGQVGRDAIEPMAVSVAQFSRISGESSDKVAADFMNMRNGVSKWATEHNKQLGYISVAQLKHLQELERQGKTEEAVRENVRLLTEEMTKREPSLSGWDRMWNSVANAMSRAKDSMAGMFSGPDNSSDAIEAQIKKLRTIRIGRGSYTAAEDDSRVDQKELARLKRQLEIAKAEETALTAKANADAKRKASVEQQEHDDKLSSVSAAANAQAVTDAAQQRIQALTFEQQAIAHVHRMNEISDGDFVRRTTEVKKQLLAEEKKIAQARVAAAESVPKPTGKDADIADRQRQSQIAAARAQVKQIEQQIRNLPVEQTQQIEEQDRTKSRALQNYTDDLKYQNELLAMEAQAVNMSDLQYRQLIETKNAEHEIRVKTRDMQKGEADGYRTAAEEALKLRLETERLNDANSRTWQYGMKSALKNYSDDLSNVGKSVETAMTNAFKGMEDALVSFVTTGKLNFKSFAQSVIADIARIYIRQTMIAPLMQAIGSFMPGFGGAGSSIGPATGSVQAAGLQASGAVTSAIPAFASGGYHSGGLRIVGENGPELEATGPSRIFNANDTRAMLGSGGSTAVTVNVDAGGSNVSGDSSKANALGNAIAVAVRQELITQQRPGGLLYKPA